LNRKSPLVILDIGVNYYDLALKYEVSPYVAAKKMIAEAKKAGADAVKFQTYKAEKLAAENSPAYWDLSEEPTKTQKELFSKFDSFNYEDYENLAAYSEEVSIEFMTTPFDIESADRMDPLVRRHKIASADITNVELLARVGSYGKPVLLSTGASSEIEVSTAVNMLLKAGTSDITLLHCVLNYPTNREQANLWKIKALKDKFPELSVGYSDHTKYSSDVLLTAWLLGAAVLEKHFTLDKSLKGNDHYHAADPEDIAELTRIIREINILIGDEKPGWYDPLENISRRYARRGVYLVRDVVSGEVISTEDVSFLRPQAEGITPIQWATAVEEGRKYNKNIKKGDLITATDIG